MVDLDELICKDLGVEVDPEKFIGNWLNNWGASIAFNTAKSEIEEDMAQHFTYWREKGEHLDNIAIQERVYDHCMEHFTWTNNWGRESRWTAKRNTRKAKVSA
jgi:hypothetical protein